MSYQALYRTYRPDTFADVLGQEHVVSVLEKAISTGKVSHAYLFCGGRGTGKTSMARIVARVLDTDASDLYEIDAASNRGIDDIRALRDAVRTLPYSSKYKIYIIDEVHMLTKEAFNALLKTLEEPPAHALFILATTDKDKVPDTILSRCQVYEFKKPTEHILETMIVRVAEKEGYSIDADAARLIALLGDGSYRDTFGVLEKAMLVSDDKKIVRTEIEEVTGAPQEKNIHDFISSFVSQDAKVGMVIVRSLEEKGSDMPLFLKRIIETVRASLFLRIDPQVSAEYKKRYSAETYMFIEAMAKNTACTSKSLERLLETYQKVKHNAFPSVWLEILF